MKFTPIFLRRFEEELEELLDFINEKYSKRYVEQFLFQIEKCVDSLIQFPYLGVNWWGIILTAMVFLLACFYIKLIKIKNKKLAK